MHCPKISRNNEGRLMKEKEYKGVRDDSHVGTM